MAVLHTATAILTQSGHTSYYKTRARTNLTKESCLIHTSESTSKIPVTYHNNMKK